MALYGVDAWIERGEAFSVYFNLFSRLSPFERRDREVGVRGAAVGACRARARCPGTVPLLAVMIGSVSFDGFSESDAVEQRLAGHRRASSRTSACRRSARSRPPS